MLNTQKFIIHTHTPCYCTLCVIAPYEKLISTSLNKNLKLLDINDELHNTQFFYDLSLKWIGSKIIIQQNQFHVQDVHVNYHWARHMNSCSNSQIQLKTSISSSCPTNQLDVCIRMKNHTHSGLANEFEFSQAPSLSSDRFSWLSCLLALGLKLYITKEIISFLKMEIHG